LPAVVRRRSTFTPRGAWARDGFFAVALVEELELLEVVAVVADARDLVVLTVFAVLSPLPLPLRILMCAVPLPLKSVEFAIVRLRALGSRPRAAPPVRSTVRERSRSVLLIVLVLLVPV